MKIVTSRDFETYEEEPLFARPKGGSGTFVFRHGRLVPKWQINNPDEINDKRSDLPAPMIVHDVQEHRNHATGEIVSTRRRHREILRDHNLVEIGNEQMPAKTYKPDRGEIARTIKESIEQLEAGHVNPDHGVMPEGYIEEPVKDLDDIEVDFNTIQNGDMIRQDNSPE